jgi:hypothetical protein
MGDSGATNRRLELEIRNGSPLGRMTTLCYQRGRAPYAWRMSNDVTSRISTPRSYLMCPPEHFAVTYAINPWMRPDTPVDPALAMRQWETVGDAAADV